MGNRSQKFFLGASILAMVTAGWADAACAQTAPSTIEEVVVTGTSLRGVAPVGSNLTSVTAADIKATGAQTIQGILANVPQLMGMGSSGQGQTGQNAQQAIIHQFGASASTSTLTLIDGHRLPLSGTNHSFADPNLLPISMVERVEVLADGVSAVYGSDAVAGVVNFITRKRFEGVQVTANAGIADGKRDYSGSFLAGKNWESGGSIFAYSHTRQGALANTARDYTNPNHIPQGGTNQGNFNCDPATLQPSGSSVIYTSATSGQTLANAAVNANCSQWRYGTLIPKTVRNNAMVKLRQEFGSNLTIASELLYATRRVEAPVSRGTLTATAFRTGVQANPFWVTPAGYTGTANTSTVRWDANELLGPGALSTNGSDSVYGDVDVEYRRGDWTFNLLALAGRDDSAFGSTGTLNSSVGTLGLNGTPNGGGSMTTPVANTNIILNQLPLTAANALDVWNPAASNRTSAAVRSMLVDNDMNSHVINDIQQIRLQGQGTLIELPAGPVKIALGVEMQRSKIFEYLSQAQNAGPASNASVYRSWRFKRHIESLYGEMAVPLISTDAGIPFVQQLDLNVSGRYDKYSDFGSTTNPKIAFDWRVTSDLKLRANWSTSFVAPPADELGADGTWNNTNYSPYPTVNTNVPVSLFPIVTQMGIPGCTAASSSCNIGALQGLHVTRGDPQQSASKGKGWSAGFDYKPSYLPGLTAQFTYWSQKFNGGSTGPQIAYISTNEALKHLLTFYPGCATTSEINAVAYNLPLIGALAPCTQYIVNTLNSSWLNLHAEGIDASLNYVLRTDDYGTFSIGDAISLATRFDESLGATGKVYSVLNTTGANSFPSVGLQMRGNLGWAYDAFNASLFVNYTGKYRNWGTPLNPVITDPVSNNPKSGGDRVKANVTADLNMSYRFKTGVLGEQELSLNIRNLFDKEPSFYNSANGYDSNVSNPIGRLVTLGLTARF